VNATASALDLLHCTPGEDGAIAAGVFDVPCRICVGVTVLDEEPALLVLGIG
jgi:hypothetical protein